MMHKLIALTVFLLFTPLAQSKDHQGKLGLGFSNQLVNKLPALSFKLQKGRSSAYGGLMAIDTEDPGGGFGMGLKYYGLLFDEPQLNFYYSLLGAYISQKNANSNDNDTGFQFDLTLGSEFVFQGLESIGFSFEFGLSFNKVQEFHIETVGNGLFAAGIHFYL